MSARHSLAELAPDGETLVRRIGAGARGRADGPAGAATFSEPQGLCLLPAHTGLNGIGVPGLHNLITRMPPVTAEPSPYAAVFNLNWLSAAGTACLFATLGSCVKQRTGMRTPSSAHP